MGLYPTFIFIGFDSLSILHLVTTLLFHWGGFRPFCKWWRIGPGGVRPMVEGICNGLTFFDIVLHFLS